MTISTRTLAVALALGSVAAASPASAQYGPSQPPANPQPRMERPAPGATAPAAAAGRKFDISKGARKAIVELQTAVNAKDAAAIPAKLAAAQAVAKTKDDRHVIAQLQLKAGVDANNNDAIRLGIEAMLASGAATPAETGPLLFSLGKIHYIAKQHDKAAAAFEQLIAANPSNSEAHVLLGEVRIAQGRSAEAVAAFQKAIAARAASGQPVPEEWYKRAVAVAYGKKLPQVNVIAMDWVKAYPSPTNWRDTLRIYQQTSVIDDASAIDLMRLARASGGLAGEGDYYRYASFIAGKGFPGEAKAVLEEGFAAKAIDRSKPNFSDLHASASAKVAADRAALPGLESAALAGSAAKPVMIVGDAYLGYADYAKAAALYRAALGKTGVDSNLANLRLGIALARSGDKAGATAAFNAVAGPHAGIAKYWLLWLSTRA